MRLGWFSDLPRTYLSKCSKIEGLTFACPAINCLLGTVRRVDFFENTVSPEVSDLVGFGEIAAKLLILMSGEGIEPSLRFP